MPQGNVGKPLLLVFPFGYLSHYLRCLMLARHLRVQFEVRFAEHEAYNNYIQSEGFDTFPCGSMDAAVALKGVQQFDFSWLSEASLEAAFKEQVRVINELMPVAVLGDATPTLKMAAEATGVSFISVINGYMSKFFAGRRGLSVTHPAYPLVKKLPEKVGALLTGQGEAFGFRAVHRPFKKLRRKYGLPVYDYYLDEMEGNHTLIPDLLSLFPQKKLPDSYHVIAPLFYRSSTTTPSASASMKAIRKTILVSMGSTGAWQNVAFLNEPEFEAYDLIVAGDEAHVLQGNNVTHLPFVHAEELYPQVDLVICHGGNGSIYQALFYGIPALCLPVHFEQEWNVAALEREGLGQNLTSLKDTGARAEAIQSWISKKDTPLLVQYKKKIEVYQSGLADALNALAAEVLNTAVARQEQVLNN